MAKLITKKESTVTQPETYVEIKHLKTMKDEAGKDVSVVDRTEVLPVDVAIEDAEAQLVSAEARVTELKSDIAEYKKIKG